MEQQLDFVFFGYGLSFILLAAVAYTLARRARSRHEQGPAWTLLALFGLLHGLNEWADLVAMSLGDNPPFAAARAVAMAFSFLMLFEFGRRGARGDKPPDLRVYALPAGLALLGTLSRDAGIPGFAAATRLGLGLFGGLWAALTLARAGRGWQSGWGYLLASAFFMGTYALVAGAVPTPAPFFPADHINTVAFLHATGVPVQMVRGLLAMLAVVALFEYSFGFDRRRGRGAVMLPRAQEGWYLAALALTLVLGWTLTQSSGRAREESERSRLLTQARLASAALDPGMVARHAGAAADMASPHYKDVRTRLQALEHLTPGARWYYLLAPRSGKLVFINESTAGTDPNYGPPEPYNDAPPEVAECLKDSQPRVAGPYKDQWGSFVSAFVPVVDAQGRLQALLGLDVDARAFIMAVARTRLTGILATLLAVAILVALFLVQQRSRDHADAVARSEQQYRSLFEDSGVPMLVADPRSGNLLDANAAAAALFGAARGELRGRRLAELAPGLEPALRPGGMARCRLALADHGERALEARGTALHWGGRDAVFLALFDETEQAQARERLAAGEARLRTLLEDSPDIILSVEPDGRISYVSPSARRLGWKPEDIVGRLMTEFLHPDDQLQAADLLRQSLNTDNPAPVLMRVRRKDGAWVTMEENGRAVRGPDGRMLHMTTLLRDVTLRRKAEEDRERLQDELQRTGRLASIGLLAGSVAHEIGNPLTVLRSHLVVLKEKALPALQEASVAGSLDRMERALDRIAEVAGSLRNYLREETREADGADLHSSVADMLSLVEEPCRRAGISVEVELKSARPWVPATAARLQQVLMNLVANARDSFKDCPAPRVIRLRSFDDGAAVCLQVEDNGCGIAPADREKLFTPFFTTKPSGTGLGLSVSQSLAQAMGGRIECEPAPERGSRFTLRLPAGSVAPPPAAPAPPAVPAELRRTRVLVVDDDEEVREALHMRLEALGQEVAVAAGGAEAFEMLKKQAFDFVVTDVKMPGMDGDELLLKLHQARLPHLAATRYLVISGGHFTEYPPEQRARILAFSHGYLLKPFAEDDLRRFFTPLAKA